ncbi:VOC family protein [Thiomicrorhabdus hydrogeniphila]
MAKITGFDHVSILVENADIALNFYHEILGLPLLNRPDLGFPGYWLDLQNGQSLHIMQLNNPYSGSKPEHGGRDYHFALRVDSIDEFIEKLKQINLEYSLSKSGRKALFTRDPDGNALELFEC